MIINDRYLNNLWTELKDMCGDAHISKMELEVAKNPENVAHIKASLAIKTQRIASQMAELEDACGDKIVLCTGCYAPMTEVDIGWICDACETIEH